MRYSDTYTYRPFSLREFFRISPPQYTRKHHGHRHGRRSHKHSSDRRNYYTPREPAYVYPTLYASATTQTPHYPPFYREATTQTYDSAQREESPRPSSVHSYERISPQEKIRKEVRFEEPRGTERKRARREKEREREKRDRERDRDRDRDRPSLISLPPELKHMVQEHLDPVSSTCLGLSSRHYYPIHRHHHPSKVSLFAMADDPPSSKGYKPRYRSRHQSERENDSYAERKRDGHPLYFYLNRDISEQWVPKGREYVLDPRSERYVRRERERERDRDGGRGERYVWDEGRAERDRERERRWGNDGRLGSRRGRGWGSGWY